MPIGILFFFNRYCVQSIGRFITLVSSEHVPDMPENGNLPNITFKIYFKYGWRVFAQAE